MSIHTHFMMEELAMHRAFVSALEAQMTEFSFFIREDNKQLYWLSFSVDMVP